MQYSGLKSFDSASGGDFLESYILCEERGWLYVKINTRHYSHFMRKKSPLINTICLGATKTLFWSSLPSLPQLNMLDLWMSLVQFYLPPNVDCEERQPADDKTANYDANCLCSLRFHSKLSHLMRQTMI